VADGSCRGGRSLIENVPPEPPWSGGRITLEAETSPKGPTRGLPGSNACAFGAFADAIAEPVNLKAHQVAASAVAAVAAASAASVFGLKGTLIGAALGSVVATVVAALVGQSFARTREAIKRPGVPQVVRRSGDTSTTGDVTAIHQASPSEAGLGDESTETPKEPEKRESRTLLGSYSTVEPSSPARSAPIRPDTRAGGLSSQQRRSRRIRVATIGLASALAAFVVALGIVTVIELAAGSSLSSMLGGPSSGTTVGGLVNGVSSATTAPPSSKTTATSPAVTPTTTSSTTSTTVPVTTTTKPPIATTTTAPSNSSSTTAAH
jgi:gas vesicle protein